MIRFIDAVVLAQTKLRTHKIRTGLTLGVAGILFGLILAVIFVAQGTFESVDRFDEEGLADRSVVHISKWNNKSKIGRNDDFCFTTETINKASDVLCFFIDF